MVRVNSDEQNYLRTAVVLLNKAEQLGALTDSDVEPLTTIAGLQSTVAAIENKVLLHDKYYIKELGRILEKVISLQALTDAEVATANSVADLVSAVTAKANTFIDPTTDFGEQFV